jgi:hypothetical protein
VQAGFYWAGNGIRAQQAGRWRLGSVISFDDAASVSDFLLELERWLEK